MDEVILLLAESNRLGVVLRERQRNWRVPSEGEQAVFFVVLGEERAGQGKKREDGKSEGEGHWLDPSLSRENFQGNTCQADAVPVLQCSPLRRCALHLGCSG